MKHSDKVAFVTGCDRGLGAALAAGLVARGFVVFSGHLDPPPPHAAGVPVPLDVRSDASVREAAQTVGAQFSHVDLLINNAGILGDFTKSVRDGLDFDDMKRTYDVNALGPLRVSEAFLPLLAAGGLKRIVNISSEAGSLEQSRVQNRRIRYGYCMSKSALNAGSVILQNSAREDGVRVLLLEPGWLKSYMHGDKNQMAELEPGEAAEAVLDTVLGPLAEGLEFIDRWGHPYAF